MKIDHYALNHFFTTFFNSFSINQKSTQKTLCSFLKSQIELKFFYTFEHLKRRFLIFRKLTEIVNLS